MQSELFDISGKSVLITGSSQGIGFGLAKGMGLAGAKITLNGRDETKLQKSAAELTDLGISVSIAPCDVTDATAVNQMIETVEANQPLDVLINNAGMQFRSPLEDFPKESFDQLMNLNINAAFYVAQAAAQSMIARKSGHIINICSLMSFQARYSIAPYTASKGAMASLTKGMATDWARHGLHVNGIAPGYFKTELNEALSNDSQFNTWLENRTPMQRWGNVDELVGAAIFLASDASSFVNGQIITVDGGITASV